MRLPPFVWSSWSANALAGSVILFSWSLTFLLLALGSGLLGWGSLAAAALDIGEVLFLLFWGVVGVGLGSGFVPRGVRRPHSRPPRGPRQPPLAGPAG